MRPFLKWAGGKYKLVGMISRYIGNGNRFVEPFAGSCAVALNTNYESYWINDVNKDLISLYLIITGQESDFNLFMEYVEIYFLDNGNDSTVYYELRSLFNKETNPVKRAALFLYLNRHGYNGLCRYNSQGQFNVPFGKYKTIYYPTEELMFFRSKLRHAKITCSDFREVLNNVGKGDVVYCDPPYVPISKTANFAEYTPGSFGIKDQQDLAVLAKDAASRGAVVAISNHYNDVTEELYKDSEMVVFDVQRSISCDASTRKPVKEVLAIYR